MKRIMVQTVYENCDEDFVNQYVENLCHHNNFLKEAKEDLLSGETVGFKSHDPTSNCYAITQYKLEEM